MDTYDIVVVGGGTMGRGLSVQFVREGQRVALVDHCEANLECARERIREAAAFLAEEGLADLDHDAIVDAVSFGTDLAAATADADVVLETVSEDPAVKCAVFETAGRAAPDDAILATNTSGLRITEIAGGVPEYADRIVGCHWWNPPYLLRPVEVVRGEWTAEDAVDRTAAFVRAIDRNPVRVERDVPGFVWNRIQFAVLREATHLVEAGVASLDDVERAIRDGYALRTAAIGPFQTVDLSGLGLFRTIAAELYPDLSDADEPGSLFDEYLEEGRTGVEAGAGFHEYEESPADALRRRDVRVAAIRRALGGVE